MRRTTTQLTVTALEDRCNPHHNTLTHVLPAGENYTGNPALIDASAVSLPNGGPIAHTTDGSGRIAQGSLPGSAPILRIFDVNGSLITEIQVYAGTFKGGVRVDAMDVTGDGIDDFLTSPGDGGGPHVIGIDGASYVNIISTFGIDDPNFRGGAYAAFGKMGNQFVIITIAGEGGGPRMTIKTLDGRVLVNVFVYDPGLRDGGTIDTADFDGDGFSDLLTAPGKGGSSHIKAIRGRVLIEQGVLSSFAEWFAEPPHLRDGANATAGLLGTPCGAPLVVTTSRAGSPDPTWFKGWNPLNGQLQFTGQIPGWPMMGAFGAIRPARTAADRPSVFVSAWLEGGDKVFEYQLASYNFQQYDCAPIVVDPPVPPPVPPPSPPVVPPAPQPLSANGLFYLVSNPGSGVPIADVAVGIGPATLGRLVFTLNTGLWTGVNNLQLKVVGALPSDPSLGTTHIDSTGTILTVSGIAYPIPAGAETFRLTADVPTTGVPLQVTSVRAYTP